MRRPALLRCNVAAVARVDIHCTRTCGPITAAAAAAAVRIAKRKAAERAAGIANALREAFDTIDEDGGSAPPTCPLSLTTATMIVRRPRLTRARGVHTR